jgi:hypothetical protein
MCCGRCYATEPRLRAALRLDIFKEILPGISLNRGGSILAAPVSSGTRVIISHPRFLDGSSR